MTDAANAAMPAATRCDLEDERRAAENHAGSSKSWDGAYSEQGKATTPQLALVQESELELTLSLGCFGTAGKKAAKKEVSSSVDSRTSISSSSTESGSPDRRVVALPAASSLIGSAAAGGVGQDGLQQPPWLHKCLNLAR